VNIDIRNEDGKAIIKAYGGLVASEAGDFKEKVAPIEPEDGLRVFMDFSNVEFIDSFGLRALMELHMKLAKKGGSLVCYRMNENVQKIFNLTRADKKIPISAGDRIQKGKTLLLTMPPLFTEVDRARAEIVEFCNAVCDGDDIEGPIGEFSIAITEAMNNAAEHSKSDLVEVEVDLSGPNIIFRMLTKGDRFDPTENVSMPDLEKMDDLPEGGFGLALIKELIDDVSYEYKGGKNVLTLRKKVIDGDKKPGLTLLKKRNTKDK
jgi:anti-anti-sigma factor